MEGPSNLSRPKVLIFKNILKTYENIILKIRFKHGSVFLCVKYLIFFIHYLTGLATNYKTRKK